MEKLNVPSNLSKVFCQYVLKSCGINAEFGTVFQSPLENYIMVESLYIEQAKEILKQCSIIKAKGYSK